MKDKLKMLTGKNPKDFEPVASDVINNSNTELFSLLVEKDDFLFDFVKENVANRLAKYCNSSNYRNLINFLKFYSPSYEEFIVSNLAKYADEDLTDTMLELFDIGTNEEKTYCAKFFSYIQDPLAIEYLNKYAYSDNNFLSSNCASTLALMGDRTSYQQAIEKLSDKDDFVILDGVKFLVAYGDKDATPHIISAMKNSSMSENIAGELPYLTDLFEIYNSNKNDALYVLNLIINGLGEIIGLSSVFDFQFYEFIEMLLKQPDNSAIATVLCNAKDKFETLTENDEYLFDENKETKQEILDIKQLLNSADTSKLKHMLDNELIDTSLFIYTALEFSRNVDKIKLLLTSKNPTIVLKSIETLKSQGSLNQSDKQLALNSIKDDNIRNIINAL